jgi:hypothetical protein
MRKFKDTQNKCYGLTIREKDLAELAFVGLSAALKDGVEGQDFTDVNQVFQRAVGYESRAREHKSYGRLKENSNKDKPGVNFVEEDSTSEDAIEVCIAECIDMPQDKPLVCLFLKPSLGKKEEVKITFDVSKCDKLFDVLLQNKVIHLSEDHVMPMPTRLAKGKYCKWHDTFPHTTNECNYFRRQVQPALNDGWLTLGDGGWTRLDIEPFQQTLM